ncbi:MAG: hypothetical protein WA131_08115 [Desulfitobacteriaceae bacterium]
MVKCGKCGIEVSEEDTYEDQGLKICEDCKMKGSASPAKPCGGES